MITININTDSADLTSKSNSVEQVTQEAPTPGGYTQQKDTSSPAPEPTTDDLSRPADHSIDDHIPTPFDHDLSLSASISESAPTPLQLDLAHASEPATTGIPDPHMIEEFATIKKSRGRRSSTSTKKKPTA